ncbi:SAP domain-containing protein [Prauserella muralis]|nr:SAP domain-containing protein [Prauserella muralis]
MPKITRHGGPSYEDRTPATQEDVDRLREQAAESVLVGEHEAPDYDTWEYRDLQAELKRRELSAQGDRDALVERLVAHDEEHGDSGEE